MRKFTRTDIQEILRKTGLDSYQAQKATSHIIEALSASLDAGEAVELRGLGSFEVKTRREYKARNPRTGEAVTAPSCRRVIFHPGRKLKKAFKDEN